MQSLALRLIGEQKTIAADGVGFFIFGPLFSGEVLRSVEIIGISAGVADLLTFNVATSGAMIPSTQAGFDSAFHFFPGQVLCLGSDLGLADTAFSRRVFLNIDERPRARYFAVSVDAPSNEAIVGVFFDVMVKDSKQERESSD